jgi:hypothetical protein
VSSVPDRVVLRRDRDLAGRRHEIWIRRGFVAVLAVVPILALFNLFGQRPETLTATAPAATLQVEAPGRVRGGLLWQARFRIFARATLNRATLILDPGWLEGQSVNTIEPSPVNETSNDGRISLDLGTIDAGHTFALYMQFQTIPTNVGHRAASVSLVANGRQVLRVRRSITIFP